MLAESTANGNEMSKPRKPIPLADELRAWRARQRGGAGIAGGLSQSEAAHRLHVELKTLQNWEQGRRTPRGYALRAILARIKEK
jgi:predicted transcriptional regulator